MTDTTISFQLRQEQDYLGALHEVSLAVLNQLDLKEVLAAIVANAARLIGAPHGYVYLLEADGSAMHMVVGIGIAGHHVGMRMVRGDGLAGQVWQTGQAVLVPDYDAWPGRSPQMPLGVARATIGVPLTAAGQVVGVLGLAHSAANQMVDAQAVPVLERFAQLASIALANARLYGALQHELAERRQAEAALRESEARWSRIVELAAEGVIVVDAAGQVMVFSPSAERIFGYAAAEVVGQPLSRLMPDRFVENHARLMQNYAAQGPDRQRMSPFREVFGRRRDGSEFPLEASVGRLGSGEHGARVALVRDISDRRAAEQALRQSERRYRSLFERTSDAVFFLGLDGRHQAVNQQAADLLGYSVAELLQLGSQAVVDPAEADDSRQRRAALLAGESLPVYERTFRRKDGTALAVEINVALVQDEAGQPLYLQSVVRDISERKRAQRALQEANARLAEGLTQTEQRSRDLALLGRMSEFLQGCLDQAETYAVVARHLQELFPQAAGALALLNDAHTLVEVVAEWGPAGVRPALEPAGAPSDCWGLRRGRLHAVSPTHTAPHCRHVAAEASAAYLCAPLLAQGEALGLLHLQAAPEAACFSDSRLQLVATLADNIALALANLRLRESLRQQSIRDALTGLFNRRYMEESLDRELARAGRRGRPVGLIMLDVDHFKQINDAYGHAAGDLLLQAIGRLLSTHLRREDIPCRYGGEEFTLILPDAPLAAVQQRAEQFCGQTRSLRLEFAGQALGPITCSAGVAVYPDFGQASAELLAAADAALYAAKRAGRDRVVTAGAASFTKG